jgi:peptide/nickel transport system substrate-binding protein
VVHLAEENGMSKTIRATAALAAAALALAACGSSSSSGGGSGGTKASSGGPTGTKVKGGTATFALQAGAKPDWIFPITDGAHYSTTNIEGFQRLLWRPLYWYGQDGKPQLNADYSLAEQPQYSNGNTVVTIKLKDWNWSDGKPVSSRDLTFLLNLLTAGKANWAGYLPGYLPDSIASVSTVDPKTVKLTLKHPVSPIWFTGNQLSQLMPIPQHVWDKTSASGSVGNYDTKTSGAKQVLAYLTSQAKDVGSYASNPLWKTVDGPWKLSAYRPDGHSEFVPNPGYSGPIKPTIDKFVLEPFTSETAELNQLRSNTSLNYGYVPLSESAQVNTLARQRNLSVQPWKTWAINYIALNFNNPTAGKLIKQLYIRQALQQLIDQPTYIKSALHDNGSALFGPIPTDPANPYITPALQQNPYPFNPGKAKSLLTSHDWTQQGSGAATCTKPGSGANQCGPGIAQGAKLSFKLGIVAGQEWLSQAMQSLQSTASQAGIQLQLSTKPFNTLIAASTPCKPSGPCSWEMSAWGGWAYGVNPVPTGDQTFLTGAGGNFGSYSDKTNDANITATTRQAGNQVIVKYARYVAQQLPVLWLPRPVFQISLIDKKLAGAVPQSPILGLEPERWYFTK